MRLRFILLFPVFAITTAAFTKNCSANPATGLTYHSKNLLNNVTGDDNSHCSLIICPLESIPIINLQVHKTVHSVRAIFCTLNNFSVCLKCYNFFSGSGHNHSILSQKTLLFPFHTFW